MNEDDLEDLRAKYELAIEHSEKCQRETWAMRQALEDIVEACKYSAPEELRARVGQIAEEALR